MEKRFEKREESIKLKEELKETTRFIREQNKWKKQAVKWGHKHPKRGVDI